MNETTSVTSGERPLFISYATADFKQALSICKGIERRGPICWISSRDVAPGENYQEEIVRAIRGARAMVLIFSSAANASDEIKKELSLASRHHVPLIALRIEDVEPSDAFAYELSTRQWIDAFPLTDKAIDALVSRIGQVSGAEPVVPASAAPATRRTAFSPRRPMATASVIGLLLVMMGLAAWWWLRPAPAAAHSMMVRLTGFQLLSPEVPASIDDTVNSEIIAAFNADGIIGVSTAMAAAPGKAPAYALGGTIHRVGDSIRVITRFTNERTGAILWSDSVDYAADQVSKIPLRIAIDAGTVIRCGLFGASTYRKSLPDAVLKDYMQYCQEYWSYGGTKTLIPARRVAAAVPDFSWGWSAVANGLMQASQDERDSARADAMRAAGRQAEDKALALDRNNSEALAHKAYLIDPHDWLGKETLFNRAISAKPLDCGCEHYGYGLLLRDVGRLGEAIGQFRDATDMLALWPDSQLALAQALMATNDNEQAKTHFEQAIGLNGDPNFETWVAVTNGTETGDFAAAITALRDPRYKIAEQSRAALLSGYQALASGDQAAKLAAIHGLRALPADSQRARVATMLAALGANSDALRIVSRINEPALFWNRSMGGVLFEPGFPAVANQLGLISYWKATHSKPDVCRSKNSPPFCRMI